MSRSRVGLRPRVITTLTLTAAIAVLLGVVALASIPGANGLIHGCYDSGGHLRVIDASTSSCAGNETSLNWNQRGRPGLVWRGAWTPATAYTKSDAVSYAGSAYVALIANTNVAPTNTGTWGLLASKGDPGQPHEEQIVLFALNHSVTACNGPDSTWFRYQSGDGCPDPLPIGEFHLNPDRYGQGASFHLEAVVIPGGPSACVRIFNLSANSALANSETCAVNPQPNTAYKLISVTVTFASGDNNYILEGRGPGAPYLFGAQIFVDY